MEGQDLPGVGVHIGKSKRALKGVAFVYDTLASTAALVFSVALAEGHWSFALASLTRLECLYTLAFTVIAAIAIYSQGLFRGIWRYTSLSDCVDIFRATALTLMIFVPVVFVITRAEDLPRSSTFITGLLMITFLVAPRGFTRVMADKRVPFPFAAWRVPHQDDRVPMLLIGQPGRAEAFIGSLRHQRATPYSVVGVLTDEAVWHGRTMHGIGVLGGSKDLGEALAFLHQRRVKPQRLVIADDQIDREGIASYVDLAAKHGLTVGRLPRITDIENTDSDAVPPIKPIALADLLRRPQIIPDCDGLKRLVENKRVLVSGAGGSIGAELVRQLSQFAPSKIVLIENTELNLYSIDGELEANSPRLKKHSIICDVRDRAKIRKCFEEHRPEIVFHAAALKHVPMVENNPIEGIRTNVLGTQNIADACVEHRVPAMVLISTDKAVNPHNVMGASKRCAEAYCQALDALQGETRFIAVRFGNVLGSTGSVVPLFQRQLAAGGPITVTDPQVTRYFMTIPEAVKLVLQATVLGTGGQAPRGHVFVLDMGDPVKIADLARRMIRLAGKEPDRDIHIVYTGLRPGEKLHEEIAHAQESLERTVVDGVFMVSPRTSELAILKELFGAIEKASLDLDEQRVLRLLQTAVPEYRRNRPSPAPEEVPMAEVRAGTANRMHSRKVLVQLVGDGLKSTDTKRRSQDPAEIRATASEGHALAK